MSIEEEEDASLKELVTKSLQSNGVLGKIQAQLRASVFLALEEEFRDKGIPLVSPPTQRVLATPEGAAAACLVQDFLQCLGLDFSLAVFTPESGHPSLWSSPGPEALSTSLGLAAGRDRRATADEKGQKTPLLIELLRERETLPLSPREQNGEASSISSNISSSSREHQLQQQQKQLHNTARHPPDPPSRASENHLAGKGTAEENQEGERAIQMAPNLPPLTLENGKKGNDVIIGSGKAAGITASDNTSSPRLSDLNLADDSKPDSDTSINGEYKQYEDDFSSLSEKDGPDEEEEEEEEEEVEEDIEEDLGDTSADDLLNSSASGVSDITKDQSLSQASSVPAYQEDL